MLSRVKKRKDPQKKRPLKKKGTGKRMLTGKLLNKN